MTLNNNHLMEYDWCLPVESNRLEAEQDDLGLEKLRELSVVSIPKIWST
jgi:hypothetical protein